MWRNCVDGPARLFGRGGLELLLCSHPPGLLDQHIDDLVLGDAMLAHLAVHDELAVALSGGDPEVGLARLPRTVHHAAHHGDPDGSLQSLTFERLLLLLGPSGY